MWRLSVCCRIPSDAQYGYYDIYITSYETVKTEERFFADDLTWNCIVLGGQGPGRDTHAAAWLSVFL